MRISIGTGVNERGGRKKPRGGTSGGSSTVPENITATWDGEDTDYSPDFALDFTDIATNDVVEQWRSASSDMSGYEMGDAVATVDGFGGVTLSGPFGFAADLTAGTWYVQFWLMRGASYVGKSAIQTITLVSTANRFLLEGGTSRILMEGGTSLLITEGS